MCGIATISWGNTLYIHAKAQLAQRLIENSWDNPGQLPWPWADTWPIAKLKIAGRELYVLSGSSGSSLAFGPGHVDGTTTPAIAGESVIAGHRDTHFRVLEKVVIEEEINVQMPQSSQWFTYIVDSIEIVDVRVSSEMELAEDDRITLVTCYPFNAIEAGGPLRYLVSAYRKIEADRIADQPLSGG
jgi:sortase A